MENTNQTFEMSGGGLTVKQDGRIHASVPKFELLEAAQSMGFWIQNIGSFSVSDLCKAPPFLDRHTKRVQAVVDFMLDQGVIVADGNRFTTADGVESIDRGTVMRIFEGVAT